MHLGINSRSQKEKHPVCQLNILPWKCRHLNLQMCFIWLGVQRNPAAVRLASLTLTLCSLCKEFLYIVLHSWSQYEPLLRHSSPLLLPHCFLDALFHNKWPPTEWTTQQRFHVSLFFFQHQRF